MANWFDPTEEQKREWSEWVEALPPRVRDVARRFQPWKLYRIDSGHRVTLYSFEEPKSKDALVTLKVIVSGDYNAVAFERMVFGIIPDEMVECDLPAPGEHVGVFGQVFEMPPEVNDTVGGFEAS